MSRKQRKMLQRIAVSFVIFLLLVIGFALFPASRLVMGIPYFLLYLYISWDVLKKTGKNIRNFDFLDENFLMSVASLGAFVLGEYSEAVAVMLFYQVGEWFQSWALARSRKNIVDLMDIAPEHANLLVDGQTEEVDPSEVQVGQMIAILPGERVPLDGVVVSGNSALDTSALTGESVPRFVHPGDSVISGCINQNGVLHVRVEKDYDHSTVSRILELVENATDKKSRSEQFITKFARIYTPAVVGSAILLAVIPSLVTGQWSVWVYRALEFMVVSCPCALVISVPMAFFGGIGGASRCGILVKGSTYLQDMDEVKTMVFDKTGTLTKGTFQVTNVLPADEKKLDSQTLLEMAAAVESWSRHPVAAAVCQAVSNGENPFSASNVSELSGRGVSGVVNGRKVCAGNARLMEEQGIDGSMLPEGSGFGTVVYISVNGRYAGLIEVADEPKEDNAVVMNMLKKQGVEKFVMLTGDRETVAQKVASTLGIDEVHASLLPEQKVEVLESLLQTSTGKVAYIGDGINDAPVLMRSDIGIAMGALGSDAAIEAADIVLMDDQLDSLIPLMRISHKTLSIARQNIVFAIAVKLLVLVLGALGLANMWAAVFADVGVSVLCILNSMRALQTASLAKDLH